MSDQCNAPFEGDSDIGGYGVLTSFIAFAVVTNIITALNIFTPAIKFRQSFASWAAAERKTEYTHERQMLSMSRTTFWLHQFSCTLLTHLSEVQLLTSIGIVLAGLIQINTLSMYHLNLISDYWWLTFTAFWSTSTQDYKNDVSHRRRLMKRFFDRERIHSVLLAISVGLSISYQIIILRLSDSKWDSEGSGLCFRYIDLGETYTKFEIYTWIVVLCLFMLQTLLSLNSTADDWLMQLEPKLGHLERRLISTHWTLVDSLTRARQQQRQQSDHKIVSKITTTVIQWIVNAMVLLFLCVFHQILGITGLAEGVRAVISPIYVWWLIQTAGDAISVKILNRSLAIGEVEWGFGQILPTVLILALFFQIHDAVEDADKKRRKRDAYLKEIGAWAGGEECPELRLLALEDILPPKEFARPVFGELCAEARWIEAQARRNVGLRFV